MSALLLALALATGGAAEAASAQAAGSDTPAASVRTDAPPSAGEASDAALDRRTAEVAAQLRCPVCRNQSVLESSSDLARRMQAVIREKLAAGESPEEVRAYFLSRYGDWILLQPEPRGLNLLVYVLPPLALVLGGVVVFLLVRRWSARDGTPERAGDRGPGDAREGAAGELTPEEERRLQRVLGRR